MMIESTENDEKYWKQKITQFFAIVDNIYAKNNYQLYTNYYFGKAIELYNEMKAKEKIKDSELKETKDKLEEVKLRNAELEAKVKEQLKKHLSKRKCIIL